MNEHDQNGTEQQYSWQVNSVSVSDASLFSISSFTKCLKQYCF